MLNHPEDELIQLQIPTAGSERDSSYLMSLVVEQLAETEKRPPRDVLNDLLLPPADRFRLCVESREAESGTLPMEEGLKLFQGGHDLLLASACSAHRPQAFYPRQSFAEAQEFIRRCRFGQTEVKCYAATIIAPVPPELQPPLFPAGEEGDLADEPYERRVTLLAMQALQTIRSAIERGNAGEILQGVSRGVSANLCDALATMSPGDSQARLHLRMIWSRSRHRIPRGIVPEVAFTESDFGVIREAARRLRESFDPRPERVEGLILSLQAEPAQLYEDFQGKVVLRTLIEGRPVRVRFVLDQSSYAVACDAHRDSRRVAVTGVLQRDPQATQFELLHPQRFQVLPAEVQTP
ncbi:MAG TPA: hypothetical protein VKA46_10320 [Gemmataceae bacterium]|nr:hypothetical protein [Gemmataceae bacterium]